MQRVQKKLLRFFAEKGLQVSSDAAEELLKKMQDPGELSEDSLDEVAGGSGCFWCHKTIKGNVVMHFVKHLLGY